MNQQRTLVVVGLGILLAILVVPFGGIYTVPALLLIAGLVVLDLWLEASRADRATRGMSMYARLQNQPLPIRLVAIAGFLTVLVGIGLLVTAGRH